MSMQRGKSLAEQPFKGKKVMNKTLNTTQLLQKKANLIPGHRNKSVIGEISEAIIPL